MCSGSLMDQFRARTSIDALTVWRQRAAVCEALFWQSFNVTHFLAGNLRFPPLKHLPQRQRDSSPPISAFGNSLMMLVWNLATGKANFRRPHFRPQPRSARFRFTWPTRPVTGQFSRRSQPKFSRVSTGSCSIKTMTVAGAILD